MNEPTHSADLAGHVYAEAQRDYSAVRLQTQHFALALRRTREIAELLIQHQVINRPDPIQWDSMVEDVMTMTASIEQLELHAKTLFAAVERVVPPPSSSLPA